MIGAIVSAFGGLATSYIDGKTSIQKANAEIALKKATSETDWEQSAISASENSWKDGQRCPERRYRREELRAILISTGSVAEDH